MAKDSLLGSHPVRVPVNNPDEIAEIFDEISYGKGASILRMIEEYLGERSFREGVYRYLKKFEYSNATASDLWDSLSLSSFFFSILVFFERILFEFPVI